MDIQSFFENCLRLSAVSFPEPGEDEKPMPE
jgi:hypothetical protein